MKLKPFKIRCSAIGKIMTNPKSKTATLSVTCMSYLDQWIKEQIYGIEKEIKSKYLDKGLIMEDNSIDFIAEHLDLGMLIKNIEHYENDFITGTPDIIIPGYTIDAKNSWDPFTFPLLATEIPNKGYIWQLQGYMALTDRPTAKLIYTLMDTPIHLIRKEAYYYARDNGYDEASEDMIEAFIKRMTYPDIDPKHKIKIFDITRDDSAIKAVEERVIECRKYIDATIINLNL